MDLPPSETLEVRRPGPGESLVVAYETDDGAVVGLLAEHLTARGVQAEVRQPQLIANTGHGAIMGSYKLVVWSEDAALSREIIDRLLDVPAAAQEHLDADR